MTIVSSITRLGLFVCCVALAGCWSSRRSDPSRETIRVGGTEAIAGPQSGVTGGGAAIGAESGAQVSGYIGEQEDRAEAKNDRQSRDEVLRHQRKEMERQEREFEDLQRQRFHDEEFRRKYGTEYSGE